MNQEGLALRALAIRRDIVDMLQEAGSGHIGGALGLADIFATLYFDVLRHRPLEPTWTDRDRLVLSPGHTNPVLYATLAESGYFQRKELLTLRKLGSRLQGHPHNLDLPGIETSSGPLGQGLSQAIGMALAARLNDAPWHTYAVLSDGEHEEGQTWEAMLFAGARQLANLTVIVDRNRIQIDGPTEKVMPLDSLADKYRAFRWDVLEIDGNDLNQIEPALTTRSNRPVCIIANTIPGKGVSFMQRDYHWHSHPMTSEQYTQAIHELTSRA